MRVLVACLSEPFRDPRPRRNIELMTSLGFDVKIIGIQSSYSKHDSNFLAIRRSRKTFFQIFFKVVFFVLRAFIHNDFIRSLNDEVFYGRKRLKKSLGEAKFDLIIVEDLHLLPFIFDIKGKSTVIFDAREYYPKQNEGKIWFDLLESRYIKSLCLRFLPECDEIITVSNGLKSEYLKDFDVNATIVKSSPNYISLDARRPEKNIKIIYHGAAHRNRKIENLIILAGLLNIKFSLDLLLTGHDKKYINKLKKLSIANKNVTIKNPVKFEEIIPTLNQYDIGIAYFEPTTFNLANCLPNKFFEYIQARLMVAIGPTPDMAAIVEEFDCGVVSEEFSLSSLALKINSLSSDQIYQAKLNSNLAARELSFETEKSIFLNLIKKYI